MKLRIKQIIGIGLMSAFLFGSPNNGESQSLPHNVEVKGISEAAFSPTGNLVALGGQDNLVYLLDPVTGAVMHRLTGHDGMVTYLAFSKDGNTLFTGSADRTVKQWNMQTKTLVRSYGPHPSNIINIAVNFNNTKMLAVSDDGTLKGYNVQTGAKLYELLGAKNLVKLAEFWRMEPTFQRVQKYIMANSTMPPPVLFYMNMAKMDYTLLNPFDLVRMAH